MDEDTLKDIQKPDDPEEEGDNSPEKIVEPPEDWLADNVDPSDAPNGEDPDGP